MEKWLGPPVYLMTSWILGTVLMLLGILIGKSNIRIGSSATWVVVILFGSVGGFAAWPLIVLCNIGVQFALPYLAIAFLASIIVIHWLLPNLAPDFQIRTLGASMMVAFLIGIGFMGSAILVGEARYIVPAEALQPANIPTE